MYIQLFYKKNIILHFSIIYNKILEYFITSDRVINFNFFLKLIYM